MTWTIRALHDRLCNRAQTWACNERCRNLFLLERAYDAGHAAGAAAEGRTARREAESGE